MKNKKCTGCKIEKEISLFSIDNRAKDKLQIRCKDCQIKYKKEYRSKNKEKIKLSGQIYRELNKEKEKKRHAIYRENNKEKERIRHKKYVEENKEKIAIKNKKYYKKAKIKLSIYNKKWAKENPEKVLLYVHEYRARKMQNGGIFTDKEWLVIKERYNHTCLRCFDYEPNIQLTIDHVVPLSCDGSNIIENIQPLCQACNSSKGTKSTDYRSLF